MTEQEALTQLVELFPDDHMEWRVEVGEDYARIWRGPTLMSKRATLDECVRLARWYKHSWLQGNRQSLADFENGLKVIG